MPSLSDLPYDVNGSVYARLGRKDLHAACLVNKTLHDVAVPYLYHTVEWAWEWEYKPIATPAVVQLLRSILHRPELGRHVRRLVCNGSSFYNPPFNGKLPPKVTVDNTVIDKATDIIGTFNVPFGRLWLQEISSGTMDAYVALLLLRLPHLTHLVMQPSFTKETRILGMMLTSSLCNSQEPSIQPAIQHVKNITFIHEIDLVSGLKKQIVQNTADILPIFYLPKLEHMAVSISNVMDFGWPYATPPDPSTLTSLELSTIREGCLGHILRATKCLSSLHWKWLYNPNAKGECNLSIMNFDKIFNDLSYVSASLTELVIEAQNFPLFGGDEMDLSTQGSRHPLKSFLELKRLTCPQFFLLGLPGSKADRLASILPINLEHLTVTDDLNGMEDMEYDDKALLQALRDWLESCTTTGPQLRSLHLELRGSDVRGLK